MGKGVLNAETAGVVGRDKNSHWEQPLPRTGVLSPFLEPLERTFDDDLGLGRP